MYQFLENIRDIGPDHLSIQFGTRQFRGFQMSRDEGVLALMVQSHSARRFIQLGIAFRRHLVEKCGPEPTGEDDRRTTDKARNIHQYITEMFTIAQRVVDFFHQNSNYKCAPSGLESQKGIVVAAYGR